MKNITVVAILVVALCVAVLAQEKEQPAAQPAGSEVVLRVNGEEVTRAEFEKLLFDNKAREFVEELVDWLLVRQAAKDAGISVSDEEVQERQDELLMQELAYYDNDFDKLVAELARFGYTVQERKKGTAHKIRTLFLVEKLVKKERSSEEKLKKLFENRFPKGAGRVARVHHILVSTQEMGHKLSQRIAYLKCRLQVASAEHKEKIETEIAQLGEKKGKWEKLNSRDVADEVVKKLRAGEDFGKIAGEYGAGYTAETYDMGWVTKDKVFNLLAPVIFEQIKPGEVAEPIQSRFGFHVVKLVDAKEVAELKYEEVKPYLLRELETKPVENAEIRDTVGRLREAAKVERLGLAGGSAGESEE